MAFLPPTACAHAFRKEYPSKPVLVFALLLIASTIIPTTRSPPLAGTFNALPSVLALKEHILYQVIAVFAVSCSVS
jgi:hypothetical protein